MCYGYASREQAAPEAAWAHGMIVVGPPPPAGELLPGGATPVLLRLVPGNPLTQGLLDGMAISVPDKVQSLRLQLQPKLVAVDFKGLGIDEKSLESGRLPSEQGGEVLAGPGTANVESIVSDNTTFKVVGRLKRDYGLFERCYLASVRDSGALMAPEASGVHSATLLQLPKDKLRDPKVVEQIEKVFPAGKYTRLMPQDRLDSRAFFTYLVGLVAFLLGGSGALISIYRGLAHRAMGTVTATEPAAEGYDADAPGRRPWPTWIAAPLLELERRPRLVWGMHLGYFGLVILGSFFAYRVPEIQTALLALVGEALSAQSGPLAAAAKAYATRNILHAAAVTFGVNFFLGTLLVITLPSFVVPGCGILMAILRSLMWGLLLAPTLSVLALMMIPHSGTLLLEGAGYILATIFAVVIPIRIFELSSQDSFLTRFRRAVLLNVQASFWVAIVLAVAALYEATEVIATMGQR